MRKLFPNLKRGNTSGSKSGTHFRISKKGTRRCLFCCFCPGVSILSPAPASAIPGKNTTVNRSHFRISKKGTQRYLFCCFCPGISILSPAPASVIPGKNTTVNRSHSRILQKRHPQVPFLLFLPRRQHFIARPGLCHPRQKYYSKQKSFPNLKKKAPAGAFFAASAPASAFYCPPRPLPSPANTTVRGRKHGSVWRDRPAFPPTC